MTGPTVAAAAANHLTQRPRNEEPTMTRRIRSIAILTLLAPLALVAACGEDDEAKASETDTTLARAEWTSTVNDLCTRHNEAIGAIIGPLFAEGPPADGDAQAALDEIVQRTRAITDEIDSLEEPSALTVHVAALVSALDAGSDQAEAVGGPAFFADRAFDPFRPAADIAGELGLDACDTEG